MRDSEAANELLMRSPLRPGIGRRVKDVMRSVLPLPLRMRMSIWLDRKRWHWLRPDPAEMTGECAKCPLASVCQAGCKALACSRGGTFFDNPHCLRRVAREEQNR